MLHALFKRQKIVLNGFKSKHSHDWLSYECTFSWSDKQDCFNLVIFD